VYAKGKLLKSKERKLISHCIKSMIIFNLKKELFYCIKINILSIFLYPLIKIFFEISKSSQSIEMIKSMHKSLSRSNAQQTMSKAFSHVHMGYQLSMTGTKSAITTAAQIPHAVLIAYNTYRLLMLSWR
jgi:ABC-type glycerol-3-phosphate transport system permease component